MARPQATAPAKPKAIFDRNLKPPKKEKSLAIIYYAGHGYVKNGRFWISSGTCLKMAWGPIQRTIEDKVMNRALIILDACHSGAAAKDARGLDIEHIDKAGSATNTTIGLLAANDWRSTTPTCGDDSLSTRLANVITTLWKRHLPLTMSNISALLARGRDHTAWATKAA